MPVVHAMDGTAENGIHPLSSSEVDELIHKADEVTLSEAGSVVGAVETRGPSEEAVRTTPSRREITGVQAQPGEATSGPPGIQPGQEPPVTMIFMGYQNVEDEADTQKVLGLQDTITAELVVIEDAAEPKEPAPPNGSAAEPPATEGSRDAAPSCDPPGPPRPWPCPLYQTPTARPSRRLPTLHPQSRALDLPCRHVFLLSFLSLEREGQGTPSHHQPPHTLNH